MADPALAALNSREHFSTSLPLSVDTTRPRRVEAAQTTAPLNVVTFRGQPAAAIEIYLTRPGACWHIGPRYKPRIAAYAWLDYPAFGDGRARRGHR